MAPDETPTTPPSNGAASPQTEAPQQSLRDIAEAAWDEVDQPDEGAGSEPGGEPSGGEVDEGGQRRDAQGRFVAADQAAKPGEAAPDGTQPREDISAPQTPSEPHPAPETGSSSEAPANWSAQDRETFSKLPPEGQAFLLRRHSEMEGDYQRRVQANAVAAQFTNSLAPIFQDPIVNGSLQQAGVSPFDAIVEWAGFHRRAMDPRPEVRTALLTELGQRMGLNPAAVNGQMSQPGPVPQLSEADLQDPAIRFFADHLGRTFSDVQALRGELHQMRQASDQQAQAETMRVTRWGIDSFADEKDAQGQPKHPHFDAVLPQLIELYRANPERDLQEAYDMAIWAVPTVRAQLLQAERATAEAKQQNARAKQAVRSNVRGITSPVSKPQAENAPQGLRGTIEASADELGF